MRIAQAPAGASRGLEVLLATFESMMRNAPWTLDDFKLSDDVQVHLLGEDVAVVAYKMTRI